MHAFLYIGSQKDCIKNIEDILNSKKYRKVEVDLLKIEDVRKLKQFTKLSQKEPIAIVSPNFDKASISAQNALLKQLEEPLDNLFFYLTAENENNLLPTIISRCRVKYVSSKKAVYSNEQVKKAKNILSGKNKGEALNEFSKIKDREVALQSIKQLLEIGREEIKKDNSIKATNIEALLKAYENIKANGNINLQLTNLVVSLR